MRSLRSLLAVAATLALGSAAHAVHVAEGPQRERVGEIDRQRAERDVDQLNPQGIGAEQPVHETGELEPAVVDPVQRGDAAARGQELGDIDAEAVVVKGVGGQAQ